jgi:methionyl-tRNA formyltransferase
MRLLMMGTGPFAVPTLEALYESRHEVLALVTRPARPLHGKTRAEANPMRELALAHGTPVHEPESINDTAARLVLASYRPDLFVVCDYGQILSSDVLELAVHGGINLHASLLPKYRGAAPIAWALHHGETETGVTVIHMTPRLDAGPAIVQVKTAIGPDEICAELEPRLAALGAPAVLAAIDAIEAGTAQPIEQDPSQATRAPRLTKSLGEIDWSRSASAIRNQIRAFNPWPNSFTVWSYEGHEPLRLIIDRAHVERSSVSAAPGTILEASGDRLVVAAGQNALAIDRIQPAGKRVLTTGEFLRGYPLRVGQHLGR